MDGSVRLSVCEHSHVKIIIGYYHSNIFVCDLGAFDDNFTDAVDQLLIFYPIINW